MIKDIQVIDARECPQKIRMEKLDIRHGAPEDEYIGIIDDDEIMVEFGPGSTAKFKEGDLLVFRRLPKGQAAKNGQWVLYDLDGYLNFGRLSGGSITFRELHFRPSGMKIVGVIDHIRRSYIKVEPRKTTFGMQVTR